MLSKSLFLAAQGCPRRMWLRCHRRELAAPTEALRRRMEAGQRVGELGRQAFGPGVAVLGGTPEERAARTRELAEAGEDCVFEATFVHAGCSARADVLARQGSAWRIVEVKMAGGYKGGQALDAAFQAWVARSSGWDVASVAVATLSREYRLGEDGRLDPSGLFEVHDVTAECARLEAEIAGSAPALVSTLGQAEPPPAVLIPACKQCDFLPHCWEGQDTSLLEIPRVSAKALAEFRANGWASAADLPKTAPLTDAQRRAVEVIRFDRPVVASALAAALAQVRFPARFVDFEAAQPELPLLPGHRCYEPLPFQWSLHTLEGQAAEPRHEGFLHDGPGDPRPGFLATLAGAVGEEGSLVHWGRYELDQLRALAQAGVPGAEAVLRRFQERGLDLGKVVEGNVAYREFRGSYSIKAVLPALVPGFGYDGMEVADGEAAVRAYLAQREMADDDPERARLRQALERYCELDTLAMVRIYQALLALAEES